MGEPVHDDENRRAELPVALRHSPIPPAARDRSWDGPALLFLG